MRITGILAGLALAGCSVGPDYRPPKVELPAQYSGTTNALAVPLGRWWTNFNDATLNSLIERAIATNHDVRITTARVREARAYRLGAVGEFLPVIQAGASYTIAHQSPNSLNFPITNLDTETYDAGFDASWELDIFGGRRRSLQAANATLTGLEENRRAVLVTMTAEVARQYYRLRGAQTRLAVLQTNIVTQTDAHALAKSRFDVGMSGELPYTQATALLAQTRAQLPVLEAERDLALHRLGVLLGRAPAALADELRAEKELPATPPAIPAGLPGDVLRQRPDVRAVERDLATATALTGVAVAELYPKFYLTGLGGLESLSATDWLTSGSRYWRAGPTVKWRILDFARVRAEVNAANARQSQALARYEQKVLEAVEEVENALMLFHREQEHRAGLETAAEALTRQEAVATDLYSNGLTDYSNVLDAQRNRAATLDNLAQSRAQAVANWVAVYKALGGGW